MQKQQQQHNIVWLEYPQLNTECNKGIKIIYNV